MIKKISYLLLFIILVSCSVDNGAKKIIVEDFSTLRDSSSGLIVGFQDHYDSITWLGIPYAEPPIGELRWRAPVSKRKSDTTIKALTHSDICFQNNGRIVKYDESNNELKMKLDSIRKAQTTSQRSHRLLLWLITLLSNFSSIPILAPIVSASATLTI